MKKKLLHKNQAPGTMLQNGRHNSLDTNLRKQGIKLVTSRVIELEVSELSVLYAMNGKMKHQQEVLWRKVFAWAQADFRSVKFEISFWYLQFSKKTNKFF